MASDLATALADLDEPRTYETVERMLADGRTRRRSLPPARRAYVWWASGSRRENTS